ncbi:MAG: prepilin-type N-terminal cleavage/methylation domain-containing protein [Planctomycetaceae bacterium]|nr:prepilin-type N-terminal cleavage/methylation domain-containing protein [Planctomycetaceae bacterium]
MRDGRRQTTDGRRQTADGRSGMTLVELMVVTSIMLLLVVISIPVVRPMLASRKQADAAQTLAIYLNSARIRASETGRDCGVMFERYTDNHTTQGGALVFPNNDSCLVVRQIEVPPPYVGMNSNVRVSVRRVGGAPGALSADITFHEWNSSTYSWNPSPSQMEDPYWNNMVQDGDKIQFDNQGPFYTIDSALSDTTHQPRITVTGDFNTIREIPSDSPVTFKVLRLPKSGATQLTLTPPIGFPSGIIVDLQYSGIEVLPPIQSAETPPPNDWDGQRSNFEPENGSDNVPVIMMFSPSGAVSLIRSGSQISPIGPIHFLIGRWDRAARDWPSQYTSPYPSEDGLRNYQDQSNFWVSIDQQTGRVRTNPVAPDIVPGQTPALNPLFNSRKYANQSQ